MKNKFITTAEPIRKEISKEEALAVKQVYQEKGYFTKEGAKLLIEWVIEEARKKLESFGVDIQNGTIDGWCDYFQYMTIDFFENLGLPVTKNKSIDAFNYKFNHYFGTTTLPILNNSKIIPTTYLIDGTYRQFFKKEMCNTNQYKKTRYSSVLKRKIPSSPDAGFFTDEEFANNLINNGYCVLTLANARKYGEGFYLSSLSLSELTQYNPKNMDYIRAIMNSSSDYSNELTDVEDFKITLDPKSRSK